MEAGVLELKGKIRAAKGEVRAVEVIEAREAAELQMINKAQ